MKSLEFASDAELDHLLALAIGRAFRLCSLGNESGSMKAKNDALRIGDEIKEREERKIIENSDLIVTTKSVQQHSWASDKELAILS